MQKGEGEASVHEATTFLGNYIYSNCEKNFSLHVAKWNWMMFWIWWWWFNKSFNRHINQSRSSVASRKLQTAGSRRKASVLPSILSQISLKHSYPSTWQRMGQQRWGKGVSDSDEISKIECNQSKQLQRPNQSPLKWSWPGSKPCQGGDETAAVRTRDSFVCWI